MKYNYLTASLICFCFISCHKDLQEKKISVSDKLRSTSGFENMHPSALITALENEMDGALVFSTYSSISQYSYGSGRIQGYYNPLKVAAGNNFIVDNSVHLLPQDEFINYDSLFIGNSVVGLFNREVTIKFQYVLGQQQFYETSFQLPNLLEFTSDNPFRDLTHRISAGSHIDWVAGPESNNSFMLLSIRCNYGALENQGLSSALSEIVIKNKIISDNGSYQLTAQDIGEFPPDAYLDIYLYRGRYTYTQDANGKKFVIGAYTCNTFGCQKQ